MIAALFVLIVALAVAVVALSVVVVRSTSRTTGIFLAHLRTVEMENRVERALLLRAVMARTGAEFGQLDRIRQQEHAAARADTTGGRTLSPEEYARWLEGDLRDMGYDDVLKDADVPLVPEGFGGG